MKLGSIVGLIIAAILVVTGSILCIVGASNAKSEGRELFMQVDADGTRYVQDISTEVTKLSIDCKDASITVNGNAERSYIEFRNFNPNRYSVSATANVITFNESADINSLLDLGDLGFSFKGLRYLLDPRNDDFDELDKSIVINIAENSSLKIIDINAENCDLSGTAVSVSGDLLLNINNGTVSLTDCSAKSTLSIVGEQLKADMTNCTSKNLRFSAKSTELSAKSCNFENSEIITDSGRIDFISDITLDTKHISVTTETGGLLFNTKPVTSPFTHEPKVNEDVEEKVSNFKISAKSANINLSFPSEITFGPTNPTVSVTP